MKGSQRKKLDSLRRALRGKRGKARKKAYTAFDLYRRTSGAPISQQQAAKITGKRIEISIDEAQKLASEVKQSQERALSSGKISKITQSKSAKVNEIIARQKAAKQLQIAKIQQQKFRRFRSAASQSSTIFDSNQIIR